jgi:hypothetical protein
VAGDFARTPSSGLTARWRRSSHRRDAPAHRPSSIDPRRDGTRIENLSMTLILSIGLPMLASLDIAPHESSNDAHHDRVHMSELDSCWYSPVTFSCTDNSPAAGRKTSAWHSFDLVSVYPLPTDYHVGKILGWELRHCCIDNPCFLSE